MLNATPNGGNCCGAFHLHSFGTGKATKGMESQVNMAVEICDESLALCEVILTDKQAKNGAEKLILKKGFRKVSSFVNGNSGNTCHVYHYAPQNTSLDEAEEVQERGLGLDLSGESNIQEEWEHLHERKIAAIDEDYDGGDF